MKYELACHHGGRVTSCVYSASTNPKRHIRRNAAVMVGAS